MISYILPFYNKAKLFKITYPLNSMYRQPDAEVICVLDDPSEEREMVVFAQSHPEVKMRIIVNDSTHEWRGPEVAYNVGIRHAIGTHCCMFDAESVLQIPEPSYLWYLINQDFRRTRVGLGWHISEVEPEETPDMLRRRIMATEASNTAAFWGFGFILAHRCELMQLCGYDESLCYGYGGDDDDIRIRLSRFGVVCEVDPLIKAFHIWHPNPYNRQKQREVLKPQIICLAQRETWGLEFSRIAYDWKHPSHEPADNSVQRS